MIKAMSNNEVGERSKDLGGGFGFDRSAFRNDEMERDRAEAKSKR